MRASLDATRAGESGSAAYGRPRRWTAALLLMLACGTTGPATAQVTAGPPGFGEVPYWTLGYAANAPRQFLGFSTAVLPVSFGGWGLYADVKLGLDSPAGRGSFDSSMTAVEAEAAFDDAFQRDEDEWTTVDFAIARSFTPDLAGYLGAGYAHETVYNEYRDASQERGRFGFYWVEDDRLSGDRLNVLGGVLLRFGRSLVFQFGGETSPAGFTVGAGLALPDLW